MQGPGKYPHDGGRTCRFLLLAFLVYLGFVIYGSLVPCRFRFVPLGRALELFHSLPYLRLGIESRADWVANILLFIPLAFLWGGVLEYRWSTLWRPAVFGVVLTGSLALSAGIEFVQIYFPPRTTSINDIVAEGIGAVIGMSAWLGWGRRVVAWVEAWREQRGEFNLFERLCLLYFVLLFGYNILPLDLTISPMEIFHKWKEGRVLLFPGLRGGEGFWGAVYEFFADAAVWAPAGWLLVRSGRGRDLSLCVTVGGAGLIEFLQLFVYSRVTDINDVLAAAIGGWGGILLSGRQSMVPVAPHRQRLGRVLLLWSGAALLWCVVIVAVFWYPFDFRVERRFVLERLAMFRKVPFEALYYGSEFHAVTEVLRKTFFYAPFGVCVAGITDFFGTRFAVALGRIGAVLVAGVAAAAIEIGQLALPKHYPDSTDILIGACAGWVGFGASRFLRRRLHQEQQRRERPFSL